MKKKCFNIPEKFGIRMIIMIAGIVIQSFGWTLLINVNFGLDPYGTLVTGLSNRIPLSFGTIHLLIQLILLMLVIRFDICLIGFGTIGNMFLLGYVTDFVSWIYKKVLPANFFTDMTVCYIVFVLGLLLLLLGAALYISSGLGVGAYDAIPAIIDEHLPKVSYRVIRLIWDSFYTIIGFLIGSKVGIVTIGIVLLAGTIISVVQKQIEKLLNSERKVSEC